MKELWKIVCCYLLFLPQSQTGHPPLPMILDVVMYLGKHSIVTEFSCQKRGSVALLKLFGESGHQINSVPINSKRLSYPIPPNHAVFTLNLLCRNVSSLLARANNEELFSSPYKWFIYYDEVNLLKLNVTQTYFTDIDILVDSEITIAERKNNVTFLLKKVYKLRQNTSIITEHMGFWSENTGVVVNKDFINSTAKRRQNLMGTTLNTCIVITHNDSLNHLTDKRDKHIDSIAKVNYVLVEYLSDINNITLNYSIQDTWGYMNDKLQWNGMMGELTRNEADIGGTPLFLTSDRVDIIDYIAMTTPTRSKFVFRQPKLSYVTNVYTLPFDVFVWISTIGLGFIIAIVLYIAIKWEWIKQRVLEKKEHVNEMELRDSLSDVIFLTFSAFCQQGASAIPFSLPGRIITIFLFISFMFLYTSYSANIVALLQSSSNSIQSLEDLLKSRLQVGVDDNVFNHFYFPNASEPIRRAIYLQKVAPPGKPSRFMPIEEGVRRMRQGLFAFHMETGAGYKIVSETFQEDEKCGLQEIQYLQVPDPWLAVQKNSSYKEILKIGLHLIQESGLQFREVNLIYSKKPPCISRGSSFISVGLVDCYPAAVVLAGGIILAFLVFIFESYIKYRVKIYKAERRTSFKLVDSKRAIRIDQPLPYFN